MLITKEQQEAMLDKYIKEKHNQDECYGFIAGMEAMFKLVNKKLTEEIIANYKKKK